MISEIVSLIVPKGMVLQLVILGGKRNASECFEIDDWWFDIEVVVWMSADILYFTDTSQWVYNWTIFNWTILVPTLKHWLSEFTSVINHLNKYSTHHQPKRPLWTDQPVHSNVSY